MPEEAVWSIEEHTLAKHELLRKYLNAWFPILTAQGFNKRVIFFDGFAGPGIYKGGQPGSPIVAMQTLVEHKHFSRLDQADFVFIFVEEREDRFVSLEEEVHKFWSSRGGQPENIHIYPFNSKFADVAADIVQATQGVLAPTLAFIDPFGWSDIPMSIVRDLLSSDKCEVLFTFMDYSIRRHAQDERPGIRQHFLDLFGMNEEGYERATLSSSQSSEGFWPDLYMKQLRSKAGFTHTSRFAVKEVGTNRTVYHLVHGTRHIRGLQVMKDATWALDPVLGLRFAGFIDDKQVLFTPEPNLVPLRTALEARFLGIMTSFEDLDLFVLEQTAYKTSHLRAVLKELEEDGRLECHSRKRRFSYPEGTQIRILSAEQGKRAEPTQGSLF